MDFNLDQNRKENCHYDHIPFNFKGNGILVFSVHLQKLQVYIKHMLSGKKKICVAPGAGNLFPAHFARELNFLISLDYNGLINPNWMVSFLSQLESPDWIFFPGFFFHCNRGPLEPIGIIVLQCSRVFRGAPQSDHHNAERRQPLGRLYGWFYFYHNWNSQTEFSFQSFSIGIGGPLEPIGIIVS